MMDTSYKVLVTNDYDMFKRLEGNRSVTELRVKKISNSIKTVGYVMNPIIVNERFEVIDGQGRLEVLRRLELPVYYIVVNGIGRKECIAMNINQTNWSLYDYIQSYAEIEMEPYVYLLDVLNAFKKNFKLPVILNAITGKIDSASVAVRDGRFTCTKEEYEHGREILSWLTQFVPIISRVQGHTEFYYMALNFCYSDPEVDNKRLYDKMSALQASLIPVVTIQQAFDQIENIYNDHARTKVYIKTNYRKYLDSKLVWYSARYANKYE